MVKADFSGNFLSSENCPSDTIVTIYTKPAIEKKAGQWGDYDETTMSVEFNNRSKVYSPSRESGNKMIVAWGDEMDDWCGKQMTIKHVLKNVKGETKTIIEAYPITA